VNTLPAPPSSRNIAAPYRPAVQPDLVLNTSQRAQDIGGKTQRPPPSAAQWLALLPPQGSTSWTGAGTQHGQASDAELVERMRWAYDHRGRGAGLSALDYSFQAEVLRARCLNSGFFQGRRRCTTAYTNDLPDALALELLGDGATLSRRRLLAMLVTCDRMRKWGFSMGAPDLATVLGCSVASVWRVVAWAESLGYLYRVHTFKPGTKSPVQLGPNLYGPGPALILHRGAYSVRDASDTGAIYSRYARELSNHRRRQRAARRATVQRYRGELESSKLDGSEAPEPDLLAQMIEWYGADIWTRMSRDDARDKREWLAAKRAEADDAQGHELAPESPIAARSAPQLPSHDDMGPPTGVKFRKLRKDSLRSSLAGSLAGCALGKETGLSPGYPKPKIDPDQTTRAQDNPEPADKGPLARGKAQAKAFGARSPSLAVNPSPQHPKNDEEHRVPLVDQRDRQEQEPSRRFREPGVRQSPPGPNCEDG